MGDVAQLKLAVEVDTSGDRNFLRVLPGPVMSLWNPSGAKTHPGQSQHCNQNQKKPTRETWPALVNDVVCWF